MSEGEGTVGGRMRDLEPGLAEVDPSLEALLRRAAPLTECAWKFRCPGEPEPPTDREAGEALGLAREVYEAGLARPPGEVQP